MRIAIVTETYPPEVNGVALTVAGLARGLRAAGHQVQVVRPRQAGVAARTDTVFMRGMPVPFYPGLRMGLPGTRHLRTLWKSEPPEAIYVATEGPLGYSALRAAAALGIPASTGFHTRFDDFARHYGLGLIAPALFGYLRRFHRRSQATLVPTTELRDFLQRAGFGNVQLLRRAVDPALFNPSHRDEALRTHWGLAPGQMAVLHVGRIAPEKNLALAVRAFRAIGELRPDAKFIWIGDGPARATLQAQNPDFVFCGMQHGTALASHYASGDLFLFPSLTETFGNVTLEALASGVPTVAFDYGAAHEHLCDECGRRVPPGDADAFVIAARDLARSANAAMSHAARNAVASLNPQMVADNLAALLSELAQARRPDPELAVATERNSP